MVKIVWSKKANQRRIAFLAYGKQKFGEQVAHKMNEHIKAHVHLLASNPQLGITEPLLTQRTRQYRSLVVHKLIKIIYFVDTSNNRIHIADLWDTRRDPGHLAQSIENP